MIERTFTPIVQRALDASIAFLQNQISAKDYVSIFDDIIANDDEGETSQGTHAEAFETVHEWIALYNPDPELRAGNDHLINEEELRRHVSDFLTTLGVTQER